MFASLDAAACAEMMDALTEIAARASEAILHVAGNAEVRSKGRWFAGHRGG